MTSPSTTELVVLLDEQGRPIGTADKYQVHTTDTPLHLAFSSYLFDGHGRVLLTRRALGKKTWPGVWTNSCCGHPGPGESGEDAIRRRVGQELGLEIAAVSMALPDFRYRAVAADGTVENEICPVWTALVDGDPNPDPDEVMEWAWVAPADLVDAVTAVPRVFSPWAVEQVPQLSVLGVL